MTEMKKVIDVINQNENIVLQIIGINKDDACDCLSELYYEGSAQDIPDHLLDCEVLKVTRNFLSYRLCIAIPYISDKDKVLNNDVIDYFQQPKYSWFVGLPCSEQETAE